VEKVYDYFVFFNYIWQAGADVNVFGSYNPLATAAEKGLTEAIKCLLEAGANPNVPDTVRFTFVASVHCSSDPLDFMSPVVLSDTHK
jgi:hypothetical protein